MFGGACALFVPSPGAVWDGMACKSCLKPKRDHKEISPESAEPSTSSSAANLAAPVAGTASSAAMTASPSFLAVEVSAPVVQPAIVIPRPEMSASPSSANASNTFTFPKPEKYDNGLRGRVARFKRDWTRERTVVAVVVTAVLLLIIILAAVLSGADEILGLTASEQARLDTANNALVAATNSFGFEPEGIVTITNSSEFIKPQALAFMLSTMGMESLEFEDLSLTPLARTCTQDLDCQSCADPTGVCDKVLGRCSLQNYDGNLYDSSLSGECPAGLCNYPYNHAIPPAIVTLFQGFPTRKKYEVNPLATPDAPNANAGALASLAPSTTYYATLNLHGFNFSAALVLFVPDIEVSPEVHFAIRLELQDSANKNPLLAALPVLGNIPGFSQFELCKGAVVFSSTAFQRMGFEVAKGANLFLRVRTPESSPLSILEPFVSPSLNQRVFNLRVLLGETYDGERGSFVDFQKDPNVVFNTKSAVAHIGRLGLQLDSNNGLMLGTFSKFNFSKELQLFGGFTTKFDTAEAVFNGYVNNVILPPTIKSFLTIKKMGFTMASNLPAIVLPRDFEVTSQAALKLGNLNLDLYVAGKFFTDGSCGFTTRTGLQGPKEKGLLKLGGNSVASVVAKIANIDSAITFLNKMALPSNVEFEVSVATKDMIIDGGDVPHGVRVMAKFVLSAIQFPSEFQSVVDFLGFGTESEVGIGAVVPFSNPNAVSIFVSFSTTPGTSTPVIQFEGFETRIKPVPPAVVELSVIIQLNFPGNVDEEGEQRPLKLVATGKFAPPTFIVQGALIGEWKNVLGVKGLDIMDAGGLVGFGAGGVNSLGAWGTVDLGMITYVNFTIVINPAEGQFAWDTHIVSLSFKTVFEIVNKLTNKDLGIPDAVITLLSPILIEYLDITVCPIAFTIGGRNVAAGFLVDGLISFLGAQVRLMGGLVDRVITMQGVPVTVKDIQMAFGVYNLNLLAPALALVDFVDWIVPFLTDRLRDFKEVCMPQECAFGICTPGPCADTPLRSQVDSVVSTIRGTLKNILSIKSAEVTKVSVWDLLNGGGPQLKVETVVGGRTFSAQTQVKTNFFVQDKLSEAWSTIATGAKASLQNSRDDVVGAIINNFCYMLRDKLCHDFGVTKICFPDVC